MPFFLGSFGGVVCWHGSVWIRCGLCARVGGVDNVMIDGPTRQIFKLQLVRFAGVRTLKNLTSSY